MHKVKRCLSLLHTHMSEQISSTLNRDKPFNFKWFSNAPGKCNLIPFYSVYFILTVY